MFSGNYMKYAYTLSEIKCDRNTSQLIILVPKPNKAVKRRKITHQYNDCQIESK